MLALLPMVPMPNAGGVPISVGLIFILLVAQIASRRQVKLDQYDLLLLVVSVLLLSLEVITALMTSDLADVLFGLARLYWITLLVVALAFTNAELSHGNSRFIFNVLAIGLLILLLAMLTQSLFYPEFDTGRDFGIVKMPLPRATGVPNSDGKIGTFLALCLSIGLYYGNRLPLWQRGTFLVGPIIGLFFTQSRSGLVTYSVVLGCFWVYRCLTEKNALLRVLRWLLLLIGIFIALHYFDKITQGLISQGVYEKNALSRVKLVSYAAAKVGDAPLLGSGAVAIREFTNGVEVHNTLLAMTLKSGLFAGVVMGIIMIYPALAFRGSFRFTFFKWTLVAGFFVEHSFYPGFVNEFLIMAYITAKWAWRLSLRPAGQPSPYAANRASEASAYA